MVDTLFKM